MSKHNDIYNILGKLESLQPKEQPVQATEKKSIYESVEARGSVLEGVGKVEKLLAEKYVGFKEAKPHPKELEMDADVRRMQIQQRADKAERELARRRAEPKNIGQKIAKDIGGPLKKLFKGDIRGSLSEVDVPEGNEFSGALAAAKAQGKKEFEVDGKTYQVKESGLQAYLGKKKYGEKGMQALQKAGRDGASKEKMAKIRAQHDKMDEAEFGEGNKFTGNLMKARAQGKKQADLDGDGDMEKVREGWDEMQAFLKKKEGPQPKGGSGKVAGKRYGGSAQKDDEGDEEPSVDGAAKKRGRPKKDKFAESELNEFDLGGIAKKVGKGITQGIGKVAKAINSPIGNANVRPNDNWLARYGRRVSDGQGFVKHYVDHRTGKVVYTPKPGSERMNESDSVDEAVRGTVFGKQGYRAPETQGERDTVAKTIKGNRAQNRADTRVTGYGSKVAPQRGVSSADTGSARGSAINVDQTGQATNFEPGIGNIDPRAQGYRGALNLGKSSQGKGVVAEKAPPGAKAERMVKHIKKGYAKDGKITPKEKSIAYATAWKAKKSGKLDESVIYEGGDPQLDHILNRFKNEVKRFQAGDELDDDLYMALYDYYMDQGEIPYGVAKARDGDPYQWVEDRLASYIGIEEGNVISLEAPKGPANPAFGRDVLSPAEKLAPHAGVGKGPIGKAIGSAVTTAKNVGRFIQGKPEIPTLEDRELNELARLAGLSEAKKCNSTMEGKSCPVHGLKECGSMNEAKPDFLDLDKDGNKKESMKKAAKEKVDECGPGTMSPMSNMGQDEGSLSVNTSMNSDGTKSVSVNATGNQADALAQMLKMAGIGGSYSAKTSDETVEEERDIEYANTPEEEMETVDAIMHQGNDLNREKEQYADRPKAGDNPMATPARESIEMPKRISKMLEGIKKTEKE